MRSDHGSWSFLLSLELSLQPQISETADYSETGLNFASDT